jgi:hypothetical protein
VDDVDEDQLRGHGGVWETIGREGRSQRSFCSLPVSPIEASDTLFLLRCRLAPHLTADAGRHRWLTGTLPWLRDGMTGKDGR